MSKAGRSNTVILRKGGAGASRIYAVHGLDGDVMSDGGSYATLAKHLDPCRVCALVYDEEAFACDSVPALAACYNRRVLEDVKRNGGISDENPILVAGYSYGCVVAHQMACQLEEAGIAACVILFDLEVTWPPPVTNSRVGGYGFLGGEAEAILLISRAFGKFEFATQEVVELNMAKAASKSIDVDALRHRAYAALNQKGLPYELFAHMVKRSGANIEKLHFLGNPWEPNRQFGGPALMVLAPDSPEFASANEINAKYCKQMQVVTGRGSHYNMLQGEQAPVQASIVHEFWQKQRKAEIESLQRPKGGRSKAVVLRQGGTGASRIYAVHGLDGDVMSDGGSYATLAKHLDPCRVCALVYDEEAFACDSVPALAACYNRRVLEDVKSHGGISDSNPIIVAGYSYGCVVAHQMACQLEEAGLPVCVILFDLEVTWPPPITNSRVGGYGFLGGEAEAILLISRAFGKFEFAMKEVVELNLAVAASQSIDVDALQQRAYTALNQKGLPYELFAHMVKRSGANIEKLHFLGNPWEPPREFGGPALMVLAPDSPEFASAREINARYCKQMEVVTGRGSHYNMLQGEQAPVQAGIVHEFWQKQRKDELDSLQRRPKAAGRSSTVVLRQGGNGASRIYAVHGLDGDVMSDGGSYATLAKHLDPCRVCALVYDEEAFACDSVPALAACYNRRALEDAKRNGGISADNPIFVAGYSYGCVVAHQMGCQLEQAGIPVCVILFDLEVTWPPPVTNSRVGGYGFLGGEAEAILLISRAFGKFEFAMKEVVELNQAVSNSQSIDVDALRQRAYAALNQKGLPYELFAHMVKRSGANIEKLHFLGNPWEPPQEFGGPALMVLAPDSPEFASAHEINARYCKQMEVVTGRGSHYNMLQGEQAPVQAGIVHQFWHKQRKMNGEPPQVPKAGRSSTVVLRAGGAGASRIYAVHGLDGDVMSDGSSYATLAKYLDPCRVCAMVYDEEAFACDSIPALAACYNRRVLEDAKHHGGLSEENPILVAGYSHGCVIAHQMASLLEEAGIPVAVILFDLEVTWPPPITNSRVGGYGFLGGEAEAILLIARAFGKFEFAMKEVTELNLALSESRSIDVDALRERGYAALNQKGLPSQLYAHIVKRGGANIEKLHFLGNPWEPPRVFEGHALMVLAPDSPEFASAKEINAKYCKQMEAVTGRGSHYNMLQGEQAPVQAGIVHKFWQRLRNIDGEALQTLPTTGRTNTVVLRPGSTGASRIYAVHGLDGDAFSDGSSYATLAKYLDPCRVCAMVYEEEAFACDSIPALAACYNRRVLEDAKRHGGIAEDNPILVAGYSYGCVVAYQMACQLEEAGIPVAVILFDLEVTWPPPVTNSRVGGYGFLGGEAEAILLIARAFGKYDFARKEVVELSQAVAESRSIDVDAFRERAYAEMGQKAMPYELFAHIVKRASANIEKLHFLGNPWEPPQEFGGPALLVLAPDSPEFASAQEINAKYCKQMEAVKGRGSHYNMLQGEHAPVQASFVHQFRQRLSVLGLGMPVPGLCPLTRGSGAVLYYLHGLDGDAFGPAVTLGEVPYLLSCSTCALEYDDEAFACETVEALVKLYKARILQDFLQRTKGERLVLAGRSCGALLASMVALQLQEENVSCLLVILDSEVVWPSKLDTAFCYEWLGGEVEATLWLAHVGGATSFHEEQVLAAVTRGRASPVAEGPARLQTQAYGQCARQLEACGVRSLKDFRNICTLASSNAQRLRQLLVPHAGSQWSPGGFFEGRALVIAGSPERRAPLLRCASPFLGDLTVQVAGGRAELYVGDAAAAVVASIDDFLSGPVQDRSPVAGLLALAGSSARALEPLSDAYHGPPDTPSLYLVPGCDGGDFGHLAALAQSFTNCHTRLLDFDEEAMRKTSLSAVATLFVRRVLQDQKRQSRLDVKAVEQAMPNGLHDSDSEDEGPAEKIDAKDICRKVVLVGHVTGASLAYEMAMQFQEADIEVALVVIQGEVAWSGGPAPDRSFSAGWLGSTSEATLLVARCLGATDFAAKEAKALRRVQEDESYMLKGQLKAACQFAYEGPERQSDLGGELGCKGLEEACKKLVMKAFWKLSERLDGMSVDGFKALVQTIADRMDWFMAIAGDGTCSEETFDGPTLLVLARDCPSDETQQLRTVSGLYCDNLDVIQVPGDQHGVLSLENSLSLAAEIQTFALHWMSKEPLAAAFAALESVPVAS